MGNVPSVPAFPHFTVPAFHPVLLNCAVDSESIKPTYRKPSVSFSLDGLISVFRTVLGDECIGVRLLNAV